MKWEKKIRSYHLQNTEKLNLDGIILDYDKWVGLCEAFSSLCPTEVQAGQMCI